jgi:hypothetical protein
MVEKRNAYVVGHGVMYGGEEKCICGFGKKT